MGYMRHHAVIVSSWDEAGITRVHDLAERLAEEHEMPKGTVSPISPEAMNRYRTFTVMPDGSKEGWDLSDRGDAFRDAFVSHLDLNERHEDGSTAFDWCLIQFGDENGDNRMLRHDEQARARVAPSGE